MDEREARTLISTLNEDQKKALLGLLETLPAVKDEAQAYEAGRRAGEEIRQGKRQGRRRWRHRKPATAAKKEGTSSGAVETDNKCERGGRDARCLNQKKSEIL